MNVSADLCSSNKIVVLIYKVLRGTAPRYLGPLTCRRILRSAATNQLVAESYYQRLVALCLPGCRR